jgi:hypothetical protein
LIARVPYRSWEQAAYIAITHLHEHGGIHDASTTGSRSRVQQDNELRHLLICNRNTVGEQAAMYVLRFALHV